MTDDDFDLGDDRDVASRCHTHVAEKAEEMRERIRELPPSPGRDVALDTLDQIAWIEAVDPYAVPSAAFESWEDYDKKTALFEWLLEGSPGWS